MTPEPERVVIVAAQNEAPRIGAALDALAETLPGARLMVADDASTDGTQQEAMRHGAWLISRRRPHGKGGNVTAAAEAALSDAEVALAELALVCDGDLGATAGALAGLIEPVRRGECDLAIASFARRVGGGFGVALRFARWAIRSRSGYEAGAPISGQRAMRTETLRELLPFAAGYGMEIGMTVDADPPGRRVCEVELDLEHRATGRTLGGFAHRARQLRDFTKVWWARRGPADAG